MGQDEDSMFGVGPKSGQDVGEGQLVPLTGEVGEGLMFHRIGPEHQEGVHPGQLAGVSHHPRHPGAKGHLLPDEVMGDGPIEGRAFDPESGSGGGVLVPLGATAHQEGCQK
jgi:hypothetical protein